MTATVYDRDWIAARIPHAGAMVLLDRVLEWDEQGIRCGTSSHRRDDNPLRAAETKKIGALCAIEYAAQALAVHSAFAAPAAARPRAGFLTSVRAVELHCPHLDDFDTELIVAAERLSGDANSALYRFSVSAGAQLVAAGRIAAVLDADRFGATGASA